jgi:predicted 2-oxoglutarate/Fe(II)-dependent dioxygenase YbiX
MILHIPNVLSKEQLVECRDLLNKADWIDGKLTAGSQAVNVKSNLQLVENSQTLSYLREVITNALKTNPLFISAVLPNHIISPFVNRYENNGAYGNHVDNSILYDSIVGKNFRTDVSCSLFFTDPHEYEGGEMVIEDTFGTHEVKLPAGDLILYPSTSLHRVEPTKTTFDTQEAVNAFDTWTKFYTTYSFQQTYDAFTRFRTGDMPVVIQNYTFYNQLSVAAPEIKGCWGFQPVPGTVQEDGTINHAANSNGSGAIIFTKAADQEGAWDFIKWFTSTDAQVKYGNNIESILGTMGRYATANEEALQQLSWTTSEVNLLLDQLNSQVEIPIIPASYGVTRNVMNAFRAVVNDYDNARDTLFWYNKDINDEITRKLEDLGLYDN